MDQRRKGEAAEPYVNHLIEVARLLATHADCVDHELLVAAVLHDVVEDTETELEEVQREFGSAVAELVAAVSDDKSLPKAERKRLQVEHVRTAPARVRLLKLADHTSNVGSLPETWSVETQRAFLAWSRRVTDSCRGLAPELEAEYDARHAAASAALTTPGETIG